MKPARRAAADLSKAVQGKYILGLVAQASEQLSAAVRKGRRCLPREAEGRRGVGSGSEQRPGRAELGSVRQVQSSALSRGQEKFDASRFADGLAEGVLNRLVRAQVIKGATTREKGKLVYQIRIENASPLVLNGLALLGTGSPEEEKPKVLTGICVSPRRSLTIPANEQVVKELGLKKGIKLTALDLSGL